MREKTRTLAELLVETAQGRTETTLDELIETFQLDSQAFLLRKLLDLKDKLEEFALVLSPSFDEGTMSTPRVIALRGKVTSSGQALREISGTESSSLEFKSSLFFDYQKHDANPAMTFPECRSEKVTHSALKTIAAFLNSSGGILYIGVRDDNSILGIEADSLCIGAKKSGDTDEWQLRLQDLLRTRFKDGDSVGNYVDVSFIGIAQKQVARIQVTPRSRLSFLRAKDTWQLYRRDGNRTLEVPFELVEEFLLARNGDKTPM